MPTPRPFGAPTSFSPQITPAGREQRVKDEIKAQVQRMKNRGGPFPTDVPVGPGGGPRPKGLNLGRVGSLLQSLNPLSPSNILSTAAGAAVNFIPGLRDRDKAALQGALFTPGSIPLKTIGGLFAYDFNNPAGASTQKEAELIRRSNALRSQRSFIGPVATGARSIGPTSVPGRNVGQQAFLGGKPVYWNGAGWTSEVAPGGGINPPILNGGKINTSAAIADRAYKEEAISTAQQTANNPLFQKYQVAELTKKYNEANDPNTKRDIGMQIWAQTNPTLAAKVKQGQAGYEQIQSAPGMSNTGGNLIGGLSMPSMNFNYSFGTEAPMPVTMPQSFGAVLPGVGMVSKTPMFDREQALRDFYNPVDIAKSAFGASLNPDPSVTKLTQDQLQALRAQYLQGLK